MTKYWLKNKFGENVKRSEIIPLFKDLYVEDYNSRNLFTGEEWFKFEEGDLIFVSTDQTSVLIEPTNYNDETLKKTLGDKILSLSKDFKLEEIKDGN